MDAEGRQADLISRHLHPDHEPTVRRNSRGELGVDQRDRQRVNEWHEDKEPKNNAGRRSSDKRLVPCAPIELRRCGLGTQLASQLGQGMAQ